MVPAPGFTISALGFVVSVLGFVVCALGFEVSVPETLEASRIWVRAPTPVLKSLVRQSWSRGRQSWSRGGQL